MEPPGQGAPLRPWSPARRAALPEPPPGDQLSHGPIGPIHFPHAPRNFNNDVCLDWNCTARMGSNLLRSDLLGTPKYAKKLALWALFKAFGPVVCPLLESRWQPFNRAN